MSILERVPIWDAIHKELIFTYSGLKLVLIVGTPVPVPLILGKPYKAANSSTALAPQAVSLNQGFKGAPAEKLNHRLRRLPAVRV